MIGSDRTSLPERLVVLLFSYMHRCRRAFVDSSFKERSDTVRHLFVPSSSIDRGLCDGSWLLIIFCLVVAGPTWAQGQPYPGPAQKESLKSEVRGELIKGKTVELEANLAIIFKTGPLNYAVLKPSTFTASFKSPLIIILYRGTIPSLLLSRPLARLPSLWKL